jgi:hypothetical protein
MAIECSAVRLLTVAVREQEEKWCSEVACCSK